MGVSVRKKGGKWFVFIRHNGRRKAKCIGESKAAAEQVKRILEAKLALGELNVLDEGQDQVPTFDAYADLWLKEHASIECKESTAEGYEGSLRNYLRPRLGKKTLDTIKREDLRSVIAAMIEAKLSRGTIKNAIAVIRRMFNEAIESGIVESNPAAKLGRFTKAARSSEKKGVALTPAESKAFLHAASVVCPEYQPLFLAALREGLRRGELVALQFGDISFGTDNDEGSRFILVQHNYVRRKHTSTKSRKSRRVDMSKELRFALLKIRDERLNKAREVGKLEIIDDLVFPSPDGSILDPDNLYHRYFLPVLSKAGIRKIGLHDLRHTFGSQLIQSGASIVYVKEQMGHYSIQVTVDIYGHLIPGANVSFVDRLDVVPAQPEAKPEPSGVKPVATPAQPREIAEVEIPSDIVDLIGGGGRTRTYDLRIMRPSL
jgi:integrase